MASLTILKGFNQGAKIELAADEIILGREADCTVIINVPAVSRKHALIRCVNGKFYIEDMKSRNHTFVNNEAVSARQLLKDDDRIKICDNIFVFNEAPSKPPLPAEMTRGGVAVEEEERSSSTVEATLSQSSRQILETQPAEKLTFLLEVTADLTGTFDLDEILPRIVKNLFEVFRQADRAFIILGEGEGTAMKLIPKVVRTRRGQDETTARFSRSIVRKCMETGDAVLSEDASADSRFDLSQSIADCRIRSVMCAPLKGKNGAKPFGVLQLDTQDRMKKFTADDLKLLMAVASQAAIALENAKLHKVIVQRAGLERDLRLAHQVQLSFLPKSWPRIEGYTFFAHYESAQEVGGDYYDYIPLPGQRVAAMLGDVAGKGVPAALLMAKVSSDARYCMLTEPGPAEAICRLNEHMQEAGLLDRFVTLEAALLDPEKHEVTFVSAGHNPAVLYRHATKEVEEAFSHHVGGLPLGVMPEFPYEICTTVRLHPGDAVLMFSDGITEAPNGAGKDFGLEGIIKTVKAAAPNPGDIGKRLIAAVKQHSLGVKQHDDITIVCFGRNPA